MRQKIVTIDDKERYYIEGGANPARAKCLWTGVCRPDIFNSSPTTNAYMHRNVRYI